MTDANGQAVFENVAHGTRRLSVWKSGFQRAESSLLVNDFTQDAVSRIILLQPGSGSTPCQPPTDSPAPSRQVTYDARVITPIQPTPSSSPALQDYTVSGEQALAEARRQGFRFGCNHCGTEPGQWIVSGTGYLAVFNPGFFQNPLDATTTYDLFAGRSLKAGWEFRTMALKTDGCGGCTARYLTSPSGSSLTIRLAITFPITGGIYEFRSFTLRGPAGARWQDAFAR